MSISSLLTDYNMRKLYLGLSKRKNRAEEIEQSGFHFLSIEYPPTQMENNIKATPMKLEVKISAINARKPL